jgi:putative CocE/NonD family hydrolase
MFAGPLLLGGRMESWKITSARPGAGFMSGSILLVALGACVTQVAAQQDKTQTSAEKISKPGVYRGYAKEEFVQMIRSTQYVEGFNGTKLHLEINRPSKDGKTPSKDRLPVLLHASRYGAGGPGSDRIWKTGYVIAVLHLRGSGNSFGNRLGDFTPEEAKDTAKVIEWLAAQPWSSGKVGMFGVSYSGGIQVLAAGHKPKGLVAIVPTVNHRDFYELKFPNGVFSPESGYDQMVRGQDGGLSGKGGFKGKGGSTERDLDGAVISPERAEKLRAEMLVERKANRYRDEIFGGMGGRYPDPAKDPVFRDSFSEITKNRPHQSWSPGFLASAVREHGVAVYEFAGWYDGYVGHQLAEAVDLNGRALIGNWGHGSPGGGFDGTAESLRFFDYYLKGVPNGMAEQQRFYFYTANAPKGQEWQASDTWPLNNQKIVKYAFGPGKSGTVTSLNDGLLLDSGDPKDGKDDYEVRYDISIPFNLLNRRSNANMRAGLDEKGLTYTTSVLKTDTQVTGHPVVHLSVTSTARDGYFFAWLEDVDEAGKSTFVTDGKLKASHRAVQPQQPYDKLGIPYHRSFREDVKDIPAGQIVELPFDFFPTSYVFKAGHRIRVTITNAGNQGVFPIPAEWKQQKTVVSLHYGSAHPSYLSLPVISTAQ